MRRTINIPQFIRQRGSTKDNVGGESRMMSSNFPGRGKFQAWYGIARHMGKLRTVVLSWNTDSEGAGQKGDWN